MTKVTRLTFEEGNSPNRRLHLREISGDVDAPLETVGQDLRTARLRRGDDLASVSRVLKIRKDHLEALEEDRLEALPGRAYAVGFVRSYADYLGLDSAQCVERFKAEIAGRSEDVATVHVIEEDEHSKLPQGWKIIAGVVILLLVYGAWHLAVSADQMLSQPATPPPPQLAVQTKAVHPAHKTAPRPTQTASANPGVVPGGTATVPAVPPPATGQAGSAPSGTTANPTAKIPAANAAAGTPAPTAAGQPAAQAPGAPAPVQVAALPPGQVYGEQNKNPRVILRVHEATKILVMGPKHAVFINRVMKPGDTYQVPNMVGLSLTTPNGGAVEVDLDGAAMGFAGREQQMTETFSLDPQAIADRYNNGGG